MTPPAELDHTTSSQNGVHASPDQWNNDENPDNGNLLQL